MAAKRKPNEIYITRIYDAPVKVVWDAWTDPKQAAKWWGPRGFTLTTHSKDLRPGGTWIYTMHGPDGTDYPNRTVYHEVEKYSRLVYDHGANDTQPALFRVTVNFSEEKKGKTRMEMTMSMATAEIAANTRKFIKQASGDSTWDRLGEYLAEQESGTHKFIINRTFHTSIETMFEMWASPEHLSRWLPPTGMRMETLKANITPGGSTFYMMTNDAGVTMYGQIHYIEISKPNLLVYTQQFCDEKGNMSRHPMAPTWPELMKTTVTLTAEDEEHVRVTVEWQPHGQVKPEELQTFVAARAGMTQGWTGSFDKLEEVLERT